MNNEQKTPTVLIILDGWGHRESPEDNAIVNVRQRTDPTVHHNCVDVVFLD